MMKINKKRIILTTAMLGLSAASVITPTIGNFVKADEVTNQETINQKGNTWHTNLSTNKINASDLLRNLSDGQKKFMNKLTSIYSYYSLVGNKLVLNLNNTELANNFKFSSDEINLIRNNIDKFNNQKRNKQSSAVDRMYGTSKFSVNNGTIYINNGELHAGVFAILATAAASGPAAMIAALTTISSFVGGPIGATIGVVVGVVGGPSIANLCYQTLQALSTGKGLYMGFSMNWIFPNISSGLWG